LIYPAGTEALRLEDVYGVSATLELLTEVELLFDLNEL
jgi:hypothetical protein